MRAKVLISVVVLLFVFLPWSQGGAQCEKRAPLFRIERNKNQNVVRYDACLLQNGMISGPNPVDVYWILENGKKEELSALEKEHAYGIESKEKLGENRFRIHIKALKNREIIIQKVKTGYKALVRIGGELSILEKVYVESEDKTLRFPEVHYVDLFGRSFRTNKPVKERVIPN